MSSARTPCHTPRPGATPTRIETWKYVCVRRAILAVVPDDADGVEAQRIHELVAEVLHADERERLGSVGWFTTTVRLDLEVRGELVRLDRRGPVRLRRGKGLRVLKPIRRRDAASLTAMVSDFHAEGDIALDQAERERSVATLLADGTLGTGWFIEAGAERAGYLVVCFGFSLEFGGRDAFVDEIYLAPGYRAQGLGTRALVEMNAHLIRAQIRAVHLEVAQADSPATRLYERLGYRGRDGYRLMSRMMVEPDSPAR